MDRTQVPQSVLSVVNFRNAKTFAFLLMCIFSSYHAILMFTKPNGNLCKSLLSDGSAGPNGEWRPFGCMTHIYTLEDSRICMQKLATYNDLMRLYFIGDSRLFTLVRAFAKHMKIDAARLNHYIDQAVVARNPLNLSTDKFTLCFFWHDEVTNETLSLVKGWTSSRTFVSKGSELGEPIDISAPFATDRCGAQPPTHLIISAGSKTMERYNSSLVGLLGYQASLELLANVLQQIEFSRTLWMLQDPVAESLLSDERKMIKNEVIDQYNNIASQVMRNIPGVEIWHSNRLIAQRMGFPALNWYCPHVDVPPDTAPSNYSSDNSSSKPCTPPPSLSDGFHVSAEAMFQNVQVLLNLYCNNQMMFSDGTCCRSPEPITPIQKRCLIFFGCCLLSVALCFAYDKFKNSRTCCRRRHRLSSSQLPPTEQLGASRHLDGLSNITRSMFEEFYELARILSKFGLVLFYFFVCDRTVFFMKTNKGYTTMSFLLPIAYFLILGLFFTGPSKETHLNNRDITFEWKGWIQVCFLIYNFTGSYRILPLSLLARYGVSAYLFLSMFGHFHYLWHQPVPVSIFRKLLTLRLRMVDLYVNLQFLWSVVVRYLDVMYRMNFFVIGICLMMNRDYLFYQFMPLVTFWFTVLILLFIICPCVSAQNAMTVSATTHTNLSDRLTSSDDDLQVNFRVRSEASMSRNFTSIASGRADVSDFQPECHQSNQDNLTTIHPEFDTNLLLCPDRRGHQKAFSVGAGPSEWCSRTDVNDLTTQSRISEHRRSVTGKIVLHYSGPPWPQDSGRRSRYPLSASTTTLVTNDSDRRCILPFLATRKTTLRSTKRAVMRHLCNLLQLSDVIMFLKLLLLMGAIEFLHRSQHLFKTIFFSGPLKRLFQYSPSTSTLIHSKSSDTGDVIDDRGYTWFQTWSFYRYSAVGGMLFALFTSVARRLGCLDDSKAYDLGLPTATSVSSRVASEPSTNETPPTSSFTVNSFSDHDSTKRLPPYQNPVTGITCRRFLALSLTALGLLGISVSVLIAFISDDKNQWTELQAFLCLAPVISYILARNSLGSIRCKYSILFAWVGNITLELFIAHYHIWLSADGNGILVLLPGYPLVNLALTSFVFVCICHEVHLLIKRLRPFIVPDTALKFFRNSLLVCVIFYGLINSSDPSSE